MIRTPWFRLWLTLGMLAAAIAVTYPGQIDVSLTSTPHPRVAAASPAPSPGNCR